jgi:hypothetical protein
VQHERISRRLTRAARIAGDSVRFRWEAPYQPSRALAIVLPPGAARSPRCCALAWIGSQDNDPMVAEIGPAT